MGVGVGETGSSGDGVGSKVGEVDGIGVGVCRCVG
jgi:hypothetical protein